MLLRLVYLSVTSVFGLLRLLPVSDRDKDAEILVLRHQITVLERQLGTTRPWFSRSDRAFLAALLHRLPRDVVGRFRLLLLNGTLVWNQRHLLHALREFEQFYTATGRTRGSRTPGHCAHCPHQFPPRTSTPASTSSVGATASAASSTSTSMPPNLHG